MADETREEQLIRDLKDLVRHGHELKKSHCQNLSALPELKYVLAIASADFDGVHPKPPCPEDLRPHVVQRSVELAIDRLARSSKSSDSEDLSNVCKLLFGIADKARGQSSTYRWRVALKRYNEKLNPRNQPATDANFKRRIYNKELLAPVAVELLAWEEDLRRSKANGWRHLMASGDVIAHAWDEAFWWLFRLSSHMSRVEYCVTLYMAERNGDLEIFGNLGPDQIADSPDFMSKLIVFEAAIMMRFARLEKPPADGENREVVELATNILQGLQDGFMFSRSEQEWLDQALERSVHHQSKLSDDEDYFIGLLESDRIGQRILARFRLLLDSCECIGEKDGSDSCPFHVFNQRADEFWLLVGEKWTKLGRRHSYHIATRSPQIPSLEN